MPREKATKIKKVKSGIAFDEIRQPSSTTLPNQDANVSFVQSRTFRVLLAGAGFLADAVSSCDH